ncbi:MAG: Crp/Fnr family transcriptional regulator [Rhodobacteraceae bacterium]|nr:Crp/Fnr family transcriptional regulator [Paracoccaceae bacterium]
MSAPGALHLPDLTPKDCSECPIRHRAVCARCEPDELRLLDDIKYYRSFQAGQPVIWAGDRMEFVASVVSGIATLSQGMEDGRRQMVGLLLPSDFVGRPGRETAPYDVTAVSDLTVCCFRRKPFERLLSTTPHIGQRLLEMTLDELDAAREWMLVLTREAMADYLGLTLETVSRQISALKKDGIIVLEGTRRVSVPDFEALIDETGDDTDGGVLA